MMSVHFFHVLLGLALLLIVRRELHGTIPPRVKFLETGATDWHMIDLRRIIIFALVITAVVLLIALVKTRFVIRNFA